MKGYSIFIHFNYQNHLGEVQPFSTELGDFGNFENYLRWEQEKAAQLGYDKFITGKDFPNPRNTNVRISIRYKEKERFFNSYNELIDYLKQWPPVAEALQFK